jgi:hypothetical protein
MEARPQRSTRRRQRMFPRRGHHSPTRTRYSKVRSPTAATADVEISFPSQIRRETADPHANATYLDGNFQCRRWYDLFAANAGNELRCAGLWHEATFNLVLLSGEENAILSGEDDVRSHRTCTDALNHQRFEWSVKPPENSRAFSASRKWPPGRRIRKPVLRRRSPVSSGVDDTSNPTFVHNLMASLAEVTATAITLQHRLKYR